MSKNTQVLVVGAGPVGLTLALDLAWRGIDVTIVERRYPREPPEPKCNHVSARSREIDRRLGIATKLRNLGLPEDYSNDVCYRTSFTGIEFARIHIPCRRDRFKDKTGPDGLWPTPEPPHRANQIFLEPTTVRACGVAAAYNDPQPHGDRELQAKRCGRCGPISVGSIVIRNRAADRPLSAQGPARA